MIDKINLFRQSGVSFASKICDNRKCSDKKCSDSQIQEFKDDMPFMYAQMYYDNARNIGIDPDTAFKYAVDAYLCYNGNI